MIDITFWKDVAEKWTTVLTTAAREESANMVNDFFAALDGRPREKSMLEELMSDFGEDDDDAY